MQNNGENLFNLRYEMHPGFREQHEKKYRK